MANTQSLREAFSIMGAEQREEYLDHLERVVDAHNANHEWHDKNKASLAKRRAEVLAMPLPRNTCPGCFMAIYDGAAEDGYCTDCNPKLASVRHDGDNHEKG